MRNKIRVVIYWIIVLALGYIIWNTFSSFIYSYETTKVSWYGPGFNGKLTANGEIFSQDSLTCASPELPFNTRVLITNPNTGQSIKVRVNDRGPFKMDKEGKAIFPLEPHPIRSFDLSKKAFSEIASTKKGVIKISYRIVN